MRSVFNIRAALLAVGVLASFAAVETARAQDASVIVPPTWQLLDYVATDYAGAVRDGAIISASEYAEMREFTRIARAHVASLPASGAKPGLLEQADALIAAVDAKAAPAVVSDSAHALAAAVLKAYPVPTAPTRTPDLARGASLYQPHCASCHGVTGQGDGPAGRDLDPPAIDFTDIARADQRSPLSLYEAISQGVAGTSMVSFADSLSTADRWALAYYVGTLAYAPGLQAGANPWERDAIARAQISSLGELSQARAAQLEPVLGQDRARAVIGWLRAHPQAVEQAPRGLALARGRVAASVVAYGAGDAEEATRLALSAYLDGVEPVEARLNTRDVELTREIETAMGAYRTSLSRGHPLAAIESQAQVIDAHLARAEDLLDGAASDPLATFLAAFVILVREGLEALLVIVALLAFLHKSERGTSARYVHLGWVLALVAGGITWAVARYAITISGAGRELTEGLSSLLAAAVLISVGLWMHRKSVGGRWQSYLKAKMSAAVDRRSAWFLFGLAFISVYREVFETILFYAALWSDGHGAWLLAGIAAGTGVLGIVAWVLLKTSRRLPLGLFFSASSVLIAILAIVLTGKGIAALQEAGWVAVSLVSVPRIELLGVFPTWQSLLAQLAVLTLLVAGFAFNAVRTRVVSSAEEAAR